MTDDFRRGVLVGLAMAEELKSLEACKQAFIQLHHVWKLPQDVVDKQEVWDIGYAIGRFRERTN